MYNVHVVYNFCVFSKNRKYIEYIYIYKYRVYMYIQYSRLFILQVLTARKWSIEFFRHQNRIQDTGYRIQDTVYRIQDTENRKCNRLHDTRYRVHIIQRTEYKISIYLFIYLSIYLYICWFKVYWSFYYSLLVDTS